MWQLDKKEDEDDNMLINIFPVNDLKPHVLSKYCLCRPAIEYINKCLLITHYAYDGRDRLEYYKEQTKLNEN
jgi:hypothetical protein